MIIEHALERHRALWLIALLALALLVQSLAAVAMVVPCRAPDASSTSHSTMSHASLNRHASLNHHASLTHSNEAMDHSAMDMHGDGLQDSTDADRTVHDCCKSSGHCTAGSCSAPAMSQGWSLAVGAESQPNIAPRFQHIPISPISSLYRPPIFG